MVTVRKSRVRECIGEQGNVAVEKRKDVGFFQKTQRSRPTFRLRSELRYKTSYPTDTVKLPNHHENRQHNRPHLQSQLGNRGVPRLPWRRGPREPLYSRRGLIDDGGSSLFVDGIPRSFSSKDLRNLFEKTGVVYDVYISKKVRKTSNAVFGFVRLQNDTEAERAIKHFNGVSISERKLWVSKPKYNREGGPFKNRENQWLPKRGNHEAPTSLFIDGLPEGISENWVRDLFAEAGRVIEVSLSKKPRQKSSLVFGFVKFQYRHEVENAIKKFNGYLIKGLKMGVSLAKQEKDYTFSMEGTPKQQKQRARRGVTHPAFRDGRKYADIVSGFKKKDNSDENGNKTIPFLFALNVEENIEMGMALKTAIIAETNETWNTNGIGLVVGALNIQLTGMYSLSPNKFLLVFESECEAIKSLEDDSMLWNIFDDLRMWSEGEQYNDRLVWMECFGIHPKCWSIENITKIGEHWGPVIYNEEEEESVLSRTHARLLVRTKAQNRIDARIRILCDSGCCEVWVKECGGRENFNVCPVKKLRVEACSNGANVTCPPCHSDYAPENSLVNQRPTMLITHNSFDPLACFEEVEEKQEQQHEEYHENVVDPIMMEMIKAKEPPVENYWVDPVIFCELKLGGSGKVEKGTSSKRPRGRPKKIRKVQQINQQLCTLDDALIGPLMCHTALREMPRPDPMSLIECTAVLNDIQGSKMNTVVGCSAEMETVYDTPNKQAVSLPDPLKWRGRPKRMIQSLPEPLYVPSTPPNSNMEAKETWNTVKKIEVKSRNEQAVISALRRSKRLLVMDEANL